jgi:hypothetical protein
MLGISCLFSGTIAAINEVYVPAGICFVLGAVLLSVVFDF